MQRRTLLAAAITAITLLAVAPPLVAQSSDSEGAKEEKNETSNVLVDYNGTLQDADGNAISGVFHLEFNLYGDANAEKASWTERQFIGVVDGTYKVPLGRTSDLPKSQIEGPQWIGVELVGEGEILRDRLKVSASQVDAKGGGESDFDVDTSKTRKLIKEAQSKDNMAFADIAQRSVEADKAKVAERAQKVGSMSAEEVERLSNLALERLGEHVADPDAHGASTQKLGDRRRVMDSVGGPGGSRYEEECPPGWVVTGISGGAGRVLDSITIICKPLK